MPEDLGPMAPFERGRSRKIYTVYRFKNWDGRRGVWGGGKSRNDAAVLFTPFGGRRARTLS